MNITNEQRKQMEQLLLENLNIDWEQAQDYSVCDEFWEVTDEGIFEEVMGKGTPITPENILKYYEKEPGELEYIKDMVDEDYDLHSWNVNAWRNS